MKYTIAICDDSASDREYVAALCQEWARAREEEVHTTPFTSAEEFLFRLGEESFDILLLDIEMGNMNGVSMARELRKVNDAIQIVFITGFSEYIAEGYEVAALHYLLKPVGKEKLFSVLDRAAAATVRSGRNLTLELPSETVRVPLRQIRYVDVRSNYVTVHAKESYTLKASLGSIEKRLDNSFYRLGRSAIVGLRFVARVTKTDVYLRDGTVLPLPRGSYEGLNRAIINME